MSRTYIVGELQRKVFRSVAELIGIDIETRALRKLVVTFEIGSVVTYETNEYAFISVKENNDETNGAGREVEADQAETGERDLD